MGSMNGLNRLYGDVVKVNREKGKVVLRGVEILNEKINREKEGILGEGIEDVKEIDVWYKENVMRVNYGGLRYWSGEKKEYG